MRKIKLLPILFILFTILFSCQTSNSDQSAGTVASLADGMAAQLLEKFDYDSIRNIAVLPFVESGTEKSNDFSLYFADELVTSLFKLNQRDLVIYERSQVSQLMKEVEFAATGLISQETAVELGKMIGVDAVVIGSMKQISGTLRINARSVSVESGKIAAVATGDLPIAVYAAILSSPDKSEKEETVEAPKTEVKPIVAMATDAAGLGDKAYNDGCLQGLKDAAVDFNLDARVAESKQQTDYVPNLASLAKDGAEVVFAVGFLMADALTETAANNPDTFFAGIDIWIDPSTAPKNVQGLLFKEHESGYIAGVVAGLLTMEYASVSDRLNNDNVVGMVLGMDIPPVEKFQAGFYTGVKSVNLDCTVLSVVTGTFGDQARGKEAAFAMIEQGADIIFQIAGLTGLGALIAADEAGVAGIGVDVDQYAVAPDAIITSAVKGVTQAAYLTIKDVADGRFTGGDNRIFGINEGATGISPFHKWNNIVPDEVMDAVDKAIADLKSGKIIAPASRAEAGYEG